MPRADKLAWCAARKAAGNALFGEKRYAEACDTYVEALVGLDFGATAEERRHVVRRLQVPITNNLALCHVKMRVRLRRARAVRDGRLTRPRAQRWAQAVRLCGEVLKIDDANVKAYVRRAMARTELGEFEGARCVR